VTTEFTGWRKSSYSSNGSNCVEVGSAPGLVGVRDTKLGKDSPILAVPTDEWASFLTGIRAGLFDR